ncbi:MAG: uracil-DNA glycosylase [Undibacterium sp.]|nr:uracil-DNA glycosylase [Opitutaceae bacterium]
MRTALNVLTDELRRLKTAGIKSVSVSEASLVALRAVIRRSSASVARANAPGFAAAAISRTAASVAAPGTRPKASLLPAPPKVVLPDGDKATRWAALLAMVTNDPVCVSHARLGKKVVLGVGNLDAQIMFVGEAPGAEEELQGEPFVGPAGQLLTKMIGGMGLKRADVYIGNIMNWRPELPVGPSGAQVGNRPPTDEEMVYCLPFIRAQIEIVQPALLVALGSTAAQGLLGFGTFKTLGEVRGKWGEFGGKPLMVTYHPSYLLRPPVDNRKKRLVWEDLLKVMERAALPISDKQRSFFLEK